MVVWPELDRAPSDDLYTNAKCLYPGTVDQHFLFPTVYSHAQDNGRIDVYSSPDSLHWSRLPGGPILEGDPATEDDGWLATHCGLVPLPGDLVGLPYRASTFPHKYPRWPDRGDRGRPRFAVWPRERLACVEAQDVGQFATTPLRIEGHRVRLNLKTPLSGEVRVEVVAITDWVGKKKTERVVEGRAFEDCDPVSGDRLSHTVTWGGEFRPASPSGRLRAAPVPAPPRPAVRLRGAAVNDEVNAAVSAVIGAAFNAVINGELAPRDAMTKAAAEANALLPARR